MFLELLMQIRLLVLVLLIAPMITACGQIGALYLPKYPPAASVKQVKPGTPLEVNDTEYTPQEYETTAAIKSPPYSPPNYSLPPTPNLLPN